MPSVITQTVTAYNPISDPTAFRALVLAWISVLSVVLLAVRPLLLDLVDLVWAIRRKVEEPPNVVASPSVPGVNPDNSDVRPDEQPQ